MTAPRPTILCVDDDERVLASVVRALRALPAEIIWTTSPLEALELVRTRDIAVLVSDVEMPELSGVDLAAAVRSVRPETVRVLLTGRQTFEIAVQGINLGEVFRYLTKPFDTPSLREVITDALRHHEVLIAASAPAPSGRQEQLARALEAEYPGVTHVERTPDGAYLVGDPPTSEIPEELAALTQLGRQK